MSEAPAPNKTEGSALHLVRVLLFAGVLALIHHKHEELALARALSPSAPVQLEEVLDLFPAAAALSEVADERGRREVFDETGERLGSFVRTSPLADDVIGFCGPTDTLIAFDARDRVLGTKIHSSHDTRDHVAAIRGDKRFLSHLIGLTSEEAALNQELDGVSGATLTSVAIQEGVRLRLGGTRTSLRFTAPVELADAKALFPDAASIEPIPGSSSRWRVLGREGAIQGSLLRTSPAADAVVGYQGPSDTLVAFGPDGLFMDLKLRETYDNEEYAVYLREDEYYPSQFRGLSLAELAGLDWRAAGVDGVSGSTLISDSISEGMVLAARAEQQSEGVSKLRWQARDLGTALVVLFGAVIGMSSLRSNERLRLVFLCVLVGYLGLVNGDMLSQALLVGWAQHGVPLETAGGLVLLTGAALLIPITTKRNVYCSHICPHGALQQLVKKRLPWQAEVPKRLARALRPLPLLLLIVCVAAPMTGSTLSLVDLEPFDAWVFSVAGWPTLTVAAVGLTASLFVPMAYCKYGCPTGALLEFLRRSSKSHRWSTRDWAALSLFALAAALSA